MSGKAKIILIGNYLLDKQESMERFAQLLAFGLRKVDVQHEIWRPLICFGFMCKSSNTGLGKWLGYLDKWIIFPIILRLRLMSKKYKYPGIRFHICDHSNAPYLKYLPSDRSAITCHDVLAIRGAMQYSDAYCPASKLGVLLQKWILYHLSTASALATVSQNTLNQLCELTSDREKNKRDWRVIYNAFNADFKVLNSNSAITLLRQQGLELGMPFILHVGSNLARKNRKMLLEMVAKLDKAWEGYICFAGKEIDQSLERYAVSLGLRNRVISVVKPDHAILLALYNACDAFIFPSFSEGFGWPIIEAQACGAPVITSNIQPMIEVSGGAALYADPHDPFAFASALISLKDESFRSDLISRGFANCSRYKPEEMVSAYMELHNI